MIERRERVVDCGKGILYMVVCAGEGLFQKRAESKSFAGEVIIPGGRGELGENHEAIVEREVFEETGIRDAEPIQLGNVFKAISSKGDLCSIRAYLLEIGDKDLVENKALGEGEFVWLPLNQAMDDLKWSHGQLVLLNALSWMEEQSRD